LENNTAAVLLVHNHPSGECQPSHADVRITTRLKEALILLDVRVIDHLVVGNKEVYSFAEAGQKAFIPGRSALETTIPVS
jgi:DNA repair protein RadC